MPIWAIVLGRTICSNDGFGFPFIFFLVDNFSVAICFCIGLLIQRVAPESNKCSKTLAMGLSIIYIIVVIVLGVWQSFGIFMFLPFDLQWKVSLNLPSQLKISSRKAYIFS